MTTFSTTCSNSEKVEPHFSQSLAHTPTYTLDATVSHAGRKEV
jgi:hypothetical protein